MNASEITIDKLQISFLQLKEKIKALGYLSDIKEGLSLLEYSSHIVLHLLFLTLAVYFHETFALALFFFYLSMLSSVGITTGTHTASHYALVKSRKINKFIVYLGYGFFYGQSYEYWIHKHIKIHHNNPNIVGVDEDINLMPWFAMNKEEIRNSSKIKRAYFKIQVLLFPIALTLNIFNVQKDSLIHLARIIKTKGLSKRVKLDLAILFSHYLCWIVIPSYYFGFANVMLFYYIRMAFTGYGMFAAFAPAHFPEEALFLAEDNKKIDFLRRQVYTTTNFTTGPIGRYMLGGVEFQLEHHLFPNCNHFHYPKIHVLLKQFCKDNDLPFNEIGWFEGIWKSVRIFYRPQEIYKTIPSN
jgi:fatty acid desaturase